MKRFHSVVLLALVSSGSLLIAQNQHAADPTLRPHHSNAIKPALRGAPAHKPLPGSTVHHAATGNAAGAPARNGTDAQLAALEHQQAAGVHTTRPAARPTTPATNARANNPAGGVNKPMNFTYKAPNVNNAPKGGVANGRKPH
jgi:hypothetical protein